jgi:hypothetical protein
VNLESAVMARLKAAGAVTAIVGAGAAARIHWDVHPQGTARPRLLLTLISQPLREHLKGAEDMIVSRVQADSQAMSKAEAKALEKAVHAALIPVGSAGSGAGEVKFWRGSSDGPRSLGEQLTEGFVHRISEDFLLRHTAGG